MKRQVKVALVHDWLIHMRGGEKVLEALAELYPDATIYTLFYRRSKLSPSLQQMKIQASWLQKMPGIRHYYRWLLPVFPWIIGQFELKDVDLVISSSHCVAKAVKIPAGAIHLCYCHTPMRYLWGFQDDYFRRYPFFIRFMIKMILKRMRDWDLETNQGVHFFISNSENVRKRIRDYYDRDAVVVHPPLDTHKFHPKETERRDYYLVVSAFVPYKRVDIVIKAFNVLPRSLMIVGSGPLDKEYRRLRKSEKISFLGAVSDSELCRLYAGARGLVFPTEEDFGIVPLEAQACGTPVIAFARGGALESVQHGVFFEEQTPEAIQQAIAEFESRSYEPQQVAAGMSFYDKSKFKQKIYEYIQSVLTQEQAHAVPS